MLYIINTLIVVLMSASTAVASYQNVKVFLDNELFFVEENIVGMRDMDTILLEPSQSMQFTDPTFSPADMPSFLPSELPTILPSQLPVYSPSASPSILSSANPTLTPSFSPSSSPSEEPTSDPVYAPTAEPTTNLPTQTPTHTYVPSAEPTKQAVPVVSNVQDIQLRNILGGCAQIVNNENSILAIVSAIQYATGAQSVTFSKCLNANSSVGFIQGQRRNLQIDSQPLKSIRIVANVSSTLPPNSNSSVIQHTTDVLANALNASISDGSFTALLQNISAHLNVTAMKAADASSVVVTPTVVTTIFQDPPTASPTEIPTAPTALPTLPPLPSYRPTKVPSCKPTRAPSQSPTTSPTILPTFIPTGSATRPPTKVPSFISTKSPTRSPTVKPTRIPSSLPTRLPTKTPSAIPTIARTIAIDSGGLGGNTGGEGGSGKTAGSNSTLITNSSVNPTISPTVTTPLPSQWQPTSAPTVTPTSTSTYAPSFTPTIEPSEIPSILPTTTPTFSPSVNPTVASTDDPSAEPTIASSSAPTLNPTVSPSSTPTTFPSFAAPSNTPLSNPSLNPTNFPSLYPTNLPSSSSPSTHPSSSSTSPPSLGPTIIPSSTTPSSSSPSSSPTIIPSSSPTITPSSSPTTSPSSSPTITPSSSPTITPSSSQTISPSSSPTISPSSSPTITPSSSPTITPSSSPTISPSSSPTITPSSSPTIIPSSSPTISPSSSNGPSSTPSSRPSTRPTSGVPTAIPTFKPTVFPSKSPSSNPTTVHPMHIPSYSPTAAPSKKPSAYPTTTTTLQPAVSPSGIPLAAPTAVTSRIPSTLSSTFPTLSPSTTPTFNPTVTVTQQPTDPLICQYGGYCRSNSDCIRGNKCNVQSAYYSQCIPDPSQYLTTNCVTTYSGQCSASTRCCDPGAVCSSTSKQCVPAQSPLCKTPSSFANPVSSSPTNAPLKAQLPSMATTTTPTSTSSDLLICQYGGYCRSNSDCIRGNKCNVQSAYYSQCIPDPSQYLTTNCVTTYSSQCSASTRCCDPGAVCSSTSKQCVPAQSPLCKYPSSFATQNPSGTVTRGSIISDPRVYGSLIAVFTIVVILVMRYRSLLVDKASAIFSKSSAHAQKLKLFDKDNHWATSMTDDMSSMESSQDSDWTSNENHGSRRDVGYDELAFYDTNDLSVTFGGTDKTYSYSDEHGNPATSLLQFLSVSIDEEDDTSTIGVHKKKAVPKRSMDATTTNTNVPVSNSLSYDDIYMDPNGSYPIPSKVKFLIPETSIQNPKQQRESDLADSFEF